MTDSLDDVPLSCPPQAIYEVCEFLGTSSHALSNLDFRFGIIRTCVHAIPPSLCAYGAPHYYACSAAVQRRQISLLQFVSIKMPVTRGDFEKCCAVRSIRKSFQTEFFNRAHRGGDLSVPVRSLRPMCGVRWCLSTSRYKRSRAVRRRIICVERFLVYG